MEATRRAQRHRRSAIRAMEPHALHNVSVWIGEHPADWSFFVQSVLKYLDEQSEAEDKPSQRHSKRETQSK